MSNIRAISAFLLCALIGLSFATAEYQGYDTDMDSVVSQQYDKTDYLMARAQRAMKRPTGGNLAWRDVMEELAKNDKLDFSRLKNVRFGLGRR
ncbi:hypothetical protein BV898_08747 [Hypsibius exemplaris]|uniref:Uncharacterized protein n=1 Tax=Hypsibius exemplaris TaxID=2072580 RepID=A0A1W0WPM9_HYPEX|nr:hypothetical protein BV898_08747 [Hypsibius exemplaris]